MFKISGLGKFRKVIFLVSFGLLGFLEFRRFVEVRKVEFLFVAFRVWKA